MSGKPRFVTWLVLVSIPLGMLVTLLALIPIKEDRLLINRQNGQGTHIRYILGFETIRQRMHYAKVDRLSGLAGLTAPDEDVLIRSYTWRCVPFSWPAHHENQPGIQLEAAAIALFYADAQLPVAASFSTSEVDRLIRERLPLWNSPDLDRDPARVLAPIRAENVVLLKERSGP